jgi:hypothetical protein
MDNLATAFGGLGLFGILIFILLVILVPVSVYAAQKWAYRCYRELRELNKKMDQLIAERQR